MLISGGKTPRKTAATKRRLKMFMLLLTVDKVSCCKTTPTQNIFRKTEVFDVEKSQDSKIFSQGKFFMRTKTLACSESILLCYFLKIKKNIFSEHRASFSYSIFSSYFFISPRIINTPPLYTYVFSEKVYGEKMLIAKAISSRPLDYSFEKHAELQRTAQAKIEEEVS